MRIPMSRLGRSGAFGGRPPGKVIVLMAAMMPVMIGGVALSVDTAVLATAKGQLQTAADAAALAGAMQLASEARLTGSTDLSSEIRNARSNAIIYAWRNSTLGSGTILNANSGNDASGDIVIGYLAPTDLVTALPDTSVSSTLFNSVLVAASRNSSHTGVVPSFFGGIVGSRGTSLRVTSTATVQNYSITGFSSTTENANLLPIVLDQTTYNAMMAGTTTDQYTYNTTTGQVTSGPDGVPESKLYPVKTGDPGNWGTVKIGVSNNSTSTLGAQIRYGITPAQLATFPNSTIQLDSSLTPPSITFEGNPGISAGIKDDLASIIGKPVSIPIYDQTGGNGNNATFRVVDFAAVRILDVCFQGNPKYVIIQPALVKDPTAIAGSPQPSWTSGGLIRLHLSR